MAVENGDEAENVTDGRLLLGGLACLASIARIITFVYHWSP